MHTRVPSVVSIVKRHVSRGRIHGSQLDDYSQRCCDTSPLDVFTGTNPFERIRSAVPATARRINRSARLTRGTMLAMICRDYAAFEFNMRACLSRNFVRPAVPRTDPLSRTKKQNYNSAIELAHISIAKLGWLCIAPTHNDVRYDVLRKPRLSARVLPQRFQPVPERLGLFGKQPHRDACGALREFGRALGAGRCQPRAPMRQRLMRPGEPLEHFEILAVAEPVAQPLGFVGPHPAEARPQRLDQFHLIAQIDDALAQRVQIFGARQRPVGRNALARAAVADRRVAPRSRRNRTDRAAMLDRRRRGVDPGDDGVAQRPASAPPASSLPRNASMRPRMVAASVPTAPCPFEQVVEGVERRLAVAGMGQRAGVVARLVAPARRIGDERRQKPHQRAPFLHGAAEIVHGVLARTLRIE